MSSFRWLLICGIYLITLFYSHSAFGQSGLITAEGAEFEFDEPIVGSSDLQNSILELLPSFITERNSEFVKKVTLSMPHRALSESVHPYISVRGAELVHQKHLSDPRIIEPPIEYCQSGLGYDAIDKLKNDLDEQARQLAVNKMLDEQIRSIINVASCSLNSDDVSELLADFIKFTEEPQYDNHPETFAHVCISIQAYVEEADITQANLQEIADEACKEP